MSDLFLEITSTREQKKEGEKELRLCTILSCFVVSFDTWNKYTNNMYHNAKLEIFSTDLFHFCVQCFFCPFSTKASEDFGYYKIKMYYAFLW